MHMQETFHYRARTQPSHLPCGTGISNDLADLTEFFILLSTSLDSTSRTKDPQICHMNHYSHFIYATASIFPLTTPA